MPAMTTTEPPRYVQRVTLVDRAPEYLGGATNLANSLALVSGVALDDGDYLPGVELVVAKVDFQDLFAVTVRCPAEMVRVVPITETNHAIFLGGRRVITPPLGHDPIKEQADGQLRVRFYVRGITTRTARPKELPPLEPQPAEAALEGNVVAHPQADAA